MSADAITKKLLWIVRIQVLAVALAIALALDLFLSGHTLSGPNPFIVGPAIILGLLLGLLISFIMRSRLARQKLRVTIPFWVSMPLVVLVCSGIFTFLKMPPPNNPIATNWDMDWRPVILVALLGIPLGAFLGWRISLWLTQAIVEAEPASLISPALDTLNRNRSQIQHDYPGTEMQLYALEDDQWLAHVRVPRVREELYFYITCNERYPIEPPIAIAIELVLSDGSHQSIEYAAPIVHYWNSSYGLGDILKEALQLLNH